MIKYPHIKKNAQQFFNPVYPGCKILSVCYNMGMDIWNRLNWIHGIIFCLFVLSLPWLWTVYVVIAVVWLIVCSAPVGYTDSGTYRPTRSRRSTSTYRPTRWRPRPIRSRAIKPYRAPRVRKPRVYKGRLLKSGVYSSYDPVFKKWRNQARHSTWRPPTD
jgi:hypothetical protein